MRNIVHRNAFQRALLGGFSLVEIIVTIVLLGILAGICFMQVNKTKTNVTDHKLSSDVVKLNQIIAVYLGEGGSLTGLSNPQDIINKLKTVRTNADAKRQVSMMTGRGVDVRLAARPVSTAGVTKAVWNSTTQRFELTTASNSNGVGDFYLDDAMLTVNYPTESRTRSTMLYNDVNGWVWSSGTYAPASYLSPIELTSVDYDNRFDPFSAPVDPTTTGASTTSGSTTSGSTTSGSTTGSTATSGSTTSGSTTSGSTTSGTTTTTPPATTLPKPINSPNGGTYTAATFPDTISVNKNGAPATGSQLKYRITRNGTPGAWINYTAAVPIISGDKFESKNFTTNSVLYNDSSIDSDTYYELVDSFTGTHGPSWVNVSGGPNLVHTESNTDPANVELSHGDTRLDLGGGEYLDAGVENRLNFSRSGFTGVPANTDFTLGELVILNGTTFNDSEATAATLRLNISLTQPATQSGTVNLNYTMNSTANTSDRLASADTVTLSNPTTSFTVTTGGVTYTLQVRMETLDSNSGIVNGNTFHVYEGASARARLVGKFVSNR